MYNCIFSGHCTEQECDNACPILVQTSYLLEQNGITMNNPIFHMDPISIEKYLRVIDKAKGSVSSYISNNTVYDADAITYLSICDYWKGSRLHTSVYNLKFSQYIDKLQKSWSYNGNKDEIDYIDIWAKQAKVLIVSNIDYVNFKDFQCQTLLQLLQLRMNPDLTTIIVTPQLSNLVGDGAFFARLTDLLKKRKVV